MLGGFIIPPIRNYSEIDLEKEANQKIAGITFCLGNQMSDSSYVNFKILSISRKLEEIPILGCVAGVRLPMSIKLRDFPDIVLVPTENKTGKSHDHYSTSQHGPAKCAG